MGSGYGNVYTAWNIHMSEMVSKDEIFALMQTLDRLGILKEKKTLSDRRDHVLNMLFGAQS